MIVSFTTPYYTIRAGFLRQADVDTFPFIGERQMIDG